MSGAQFFLLFLVFAWPVLFGAVMEFRKRLSIWLWLEGQWEERKRLLSLGTRKRKVRDERQILLFPPLVGPRGDAESTERKVKVWR